ncbi:RNA-directed DNA polymerase-like protein [Gossypium australe]|uniref:RNA-directed DNA polymerase-like protein n=1 Tax=Gossypium australe TaxID=47621 RepID=A0A5B6VUZ5_9ROSI|nr:RNA-directed DNA polymerase-like protein [Gossypium australe]
MVMKANGRWTMCIDFTNLNKAFLKDNFLLPSIDCLVYASADQRFVSFMDTFLGYNQILLDQGDQEKTTFVTEEGLFYYRAMPFGLKNTGATYQSRGLKVYVDNILVNSGSLGEHVQSLFETFAILRAHNMKLNPKMCAFSVRASRFLGFFISESGIEVNPKKICAIMVKPPL